MISRIPHFDAAINPTSVTRVMSLELTGPPASGYKGPQYKVIVSHREGKQDHSVHMIFPDYEQASQVIDEIVAWIRAGQVEQVLNKPGWYLSNFKPSNAKEGERPTAKIDIHQHLNDPTEEMKERG